LIILGSISRKWVSTIFGGGRSPRTDRAHTEPVPPELYAK
jgi:hypothetical protein